MKKTVLITITLFSLFITSCDDDGNNNKSITCGNGIIDTNEECDSTNLNNLSCTDFGFSDGTLSCTQECKFDTDNCMNPTLCGNGIIDTNEECDSTNLNNSSCVSMGYYGGQLLCTDSCTYDPTECIAAGKCGDGIINGDEECDSTNLNNLSCVSMGYHGGQLLCTDSCTYDPTECIAAGKCGDGIINGNEECDSNDLTNSCLHAGYWYGTVDSCDASCMISMNSDCHYAVLWGTEYIDYGSSVITDNNGNIYVAGTTNGSLDGNLSNGNSDIFLSKYNHDASKIWTVQWGSSNNEENNHTTTDSDGNIYVAGYTEGSLDGNTNAGSYDVYLTKYSSTGSKIWTKQWGGTNSDMAKGLVADSSRNIYVTGYTFGSLDGNTSSGATDAFLTKYTSDGSRLWTVQWGSSDYDYANSVSTDSDGNIYVAGYTWSAFDGNTSSGATDAFLTKYTSDGSRLWTVQWGSLNYDYANSVTINGNNNIYVTGYTEGSIDGNTNAGGSDIFLTKYDPNGTKLWTKQWGSSNNEEGKSVSADSTGNIYITGYTEGNLNNNTNAGGSDIYLIKCNSSGTLLWTKQWGTVFNDYGNSVSAAGSNDIYVTGYTFHSLDGNSNAGQADIFLIRSSPEAQ